MTIHMSARLAWHLNGWNGHVCEDPAENTYCVGSHSYPGEMIAEPVSEPVVVGIGGQDGFAEEGGESALTLRDPRLDVVEAVVPSGDEEEQPNGEDIARGERAFPVKRGGKVAVQGGRQVQTLENGPQDGEVGHGFHT